MTASISPNYTELKRLARNQLRRESAANAVETTSLVHECYIRLRQSNTLAPENRGHFFGAAAQAMRRILVDHARTRSAQKRGAGLEVRLPSVTNLATRKIATLLAIDEALEVLSNSDPVKGKLLEMRFFGGFTAEESAEVLHMPVNEVRKELRVAQAWLRREIVGKNGDEDESRSVQAVSGNR